MAQSSASLSSLPLVVALTGASGAVYGIRLLESLLLLGREVELMISPAAVEVIQHELGLAICPDQFEARQLWFRPDGAPWWSVLGEPFSPVTRQLAYVTGGGDSLPSDAAAAWPQSAATAALKYYRHYDFGAPPASGSHRTAGMVICPCSGGTLSGIVHGTSANLILRAAEVHLKERRRLILVPRETPLSLPYANNLRDAVQAGAVVLPASPGWYHGVRRIHDLVDFVVARVLDHLGIEHQLMRPWGGE